MKHCSPLSSTVKKRAGYYLQGGWIRGSLLLLSSQRVVSLGPQIFASVSPMRNSCMYNDLDPSNVGTPVLRPLNEGTSIIRALSWHMLTKALGDEVELVNVGLPRKQWLSSQHLQEQTPDGPDVDGSTITGVPYQQLGGPVPSGGHIVCVYLTRGSWMGGGGEGKQ